MYTHTCIKCNTEYKDDDVDAYYCSNCNEEKKIIAAEINKKFANRVTEKPASLLQRYDEMTKIRGTKFINIKDLGV